MKTSFLLLSALLLVMPNVGLAQNDDSLGSRKVVNRVTPAYPALARNMNLSGSVKLEAVVEPNGSVKTVQVRGGNPVLAQAAENAVRGWRWEKSDRETVEPVQVEFKP